jgi:AhpD family alkylhydroperoxidase
MMRSCLALSAGLLLAAACAIRAEEPPKTDPPKSEPRPVPVTRPEVKQFLEDMKERKPRIPLPELTEEEKAKLGERGAGYESRLRALYMPGSDARGGFFFGRENEPGMSLDYKFKTQLFWIVSRTNNCQYCLGHQEVKLASAGMKEEEIAALDGDWSQFTPAQRAAYAFARKFTYEPHRLGDADVEKLREHYKDLQILEMILSMAGNNAINRWKEGTGAPQSKDLTGFGRGSANPPADPPPSFKTFLTPTPDEFKDKVSKVAPLQIDEKTGKPSQVCVMKRPVLESREDVEKALEAARKRTPRLPLVEEAKAREALGENAPKDALPQWVLLLTNFPVSGKARVASIRDAEEKGDLKPLLKAQVSWIIARQDRAWYAVGLAKQRLKDLGWSEDQIYKLDGDWKDFTPAERSLFTVARKLAASPVVLTDEDVAEALKQTGPKEVVQLISYTTGRASFDRITEAAGLRLEK